MPGESLTSDVELLRMLPPRDAQSFRKLYDRHVQAVYLYALSIVRSHADAEDVCQEVWVVLWTKRSRVVLLGQSVLPWLLVTARFKALKRSESLRRHDHLPLRPDLMLASQANDPEVSVEYSELGEHLRSIVSSMSQIDKEIYELCVQQGKSYESAARALGSSSGAVRNRLSRVRKRLRSGVVEMGETQ